MLDPAAGSVAMRRSRGSRTGNDGVNAIDDSALPDFDQRLAQTSAPASKAASEARPSAAPAVPPAFREVYDEHFAFVWRCAANRGVRGATLDDVVQEVFIVVHRKLPEFEGRSSLRTWLAAIVRRVAADYQHKRGNQPAGDQSLEREPAAAGSPAEQLERKAALELLDALLAKMSAEQREVFVLHELEHMSGPEIAELTATNENTVWTRLRAARRIFQEGVTRERARSAREQS
jgi:RNA polymerase sigma-70 factor (ECF subfamily)